MDANQEIVFEFLPLIRTYKSGRVERLTGTDVVPACADPITGVTSKDVVVQTETGVSARIYLPILPESSEKKLPLLIYFHGGGFCIETAFSPLYQSHLNALVSQANIVAVSVNYRRAPEHPLPAGFDDSWAALEWVALHALGAGPEPWLARHGDFGRVFLAGDSAGATIVHNMAMRAGAAGLGAGVKIKGVALVHPFFWGSKPVGSETVDSATRVRMEDLWSFACPSSAGIDDPRINPMAEGAPSLVELACERVLVCVAEKDFLCEWGRAYYDALKRTGWGGPAELLQTDGEAHVFHLFKPGCQNAVAMMGHLVNFFNRN